MLHPFRIIHLTYWLSLNHHNSYYYYNLSRDTNLLVQKKNDGEDTGACTSRLPKILAVTLPLVGEVDFDVFGDVTLTV